MLTSRIRALMLGMLAVMLAGSIMASTASAVAGPFWHHRAIGGEGVGAKVEPKGPENFKGEGGVQTLKGTIGGEAIEITSKSTQIKGAAFNNTLQGQIKLQIVYNQPTLVKPSKPGCNVTVGEKNIVQVKGHLVWKWDGSEAQLKENPVVNQTPEIAFTAIEPAAGTAEYNRGSFTTVTLGPVGPCGILAGTYPVEGSELGIPNPATVETWNRILEVRTVEHQSRILTHFWNGTAFAEANLGLLFNHNAASLVGQSKVEAEQQELAVFAS